MTTFDDGPAKGQTLMLQRTPKYLRVTHDGKKWDALNNLEDTAQPTETLYAYVTKDGPRGSVHIHRSGGRGGFYPLISYQLVPDQPNDATMRDNAKWAAWVEAKVNS